MQNEVRSQTPKGKRVRDHLIEIGEWLFAGDGFHGTSMRDLANGAGVPLATAVYHFARKEQLYAAVLERIASELFASIEPAIHERDPRRALDLLLTALVGWTVREPRRVKLLLRELLDNPTRVVRASKLPLAPFLERASAIVAAAVPTETPELAMLHVVGGVSYLVAARPTVDRMVGKARAHELAAAWEREALALSYRTLGVEQ